jgi:iron complex outermembrane receptor protein
MNALRSARPWYRSPLSYAIASALACAAATPAMAQDDGAQADAAPSLQAPADPQTLDVIVVTANKREENIREIAASISVIGERQLENMGANSLSDFADLIPGLQVQDNGNPGLTSVSMRGISALSSGATVATYIDEVPLGSSGLYQGANTLALDLLPYDIDRIEVLRGPQGTLYGAGAIGGLLKYVTREPDLVGQEFRASVGMTSVRDGGSDWRARVAGSVPLKEDRLGLRLSLARNGIPGFTDNAIDGREDINEGDQLGARVALLWRGDAVDVNFGVLQQRIDSDNRANVALDPETQEPLFGELTDQIWQPQPFEKDVTLTSLSFDWDLGWGNFVSATSASQTDTSNQIDATVQFGEVADLLLGLPAPGSSFVRYDFDLDKVTQEFRLTSKGGGQFEWMVGTFYTEEDALQEQFVPLYQRDGSPLPPPADAMFGTLAQIALPSRYEEIALFANASWRFSDRFKLDAGIRHARNDQWFSQNVSAGILAPIGNAPGESDEDVFTWSLGPQFTLGDNVMLYARFATGYQPGGPNVALPGMPASVDSSMLASYEIGVKSEFADRSAGLDVAAFRIEWDDIQVASSFNGVGGLVNGGEATSEGVELASWFRATDDLQFGINAAYTKARVKNDFAPTVIPQDGFDVVLNTGLAGDRMPYVPKLSWSATAEYGFMTRGGFAGQVGAAYRWVGDRLNDTTERQRVTAPGDPSNVLQEVITHPLELNSYRALDLYAGIGRGAWEVRAYVNNATDERAWSSMTLIAGALSSQAAQIAAVPIQPRTFGIELDFSF